MSDIEKQTQKTPSGMEVKVSVTSNNKNEIMSVRIEADTLEGAILITNPTGGALYYDDFEKLMRAYLDSK
jgi:hypothetical protein